MMPESYYKSLEKNRRLCFEIVLILSYLRGKLWGMSEDLGVGLGRPGLPPSGRDLNSRSLVMKVTDTSDELLDGAPLTCRHWFRGRCSSLCIVSALNSSSNLLHECRESFRVVYSWLSIPSRVTNQ